MHNHLYTYNVSTDESFDFLAGAFAGALRVVVPVASIAVDYKGQKLYHPFQVAVNGRPGSGKSSFIARTVSGFLPQPVEHTKRIAPSADETRSVTVWSRWIARHMPFEVRTEDLMAQDSLAGTGSNIFLPQAEMPTISFYEHADPSTRECCPMSIAIFYDNANHHRFLRVGANDNVVALSGFEQEFAAPARVLQID